MTKIHLTEKQDAASEREALLNIVNADLYQQWTRTTAQYPTDQAIVYLALGVAGEGGEVADKVKKVLRDGGGSMSDEAARGIIQELGDVLWYVARMADEMGVTMAELMAISRDKLNSRKKRGTIGGSGDRR